MTKVFIAGSRQITRLPADVSTRLDVMIEKGFQILVGDANGAGSRDDGELLRRRLDASKYSFARTVGVVMSSSP
jgi:hypothetical protein